MDVRSINEIDVKSVTGTDQGAQPVSSRVGGRLYGVTTISSDLNALCVSVTWHHDDSSSEGTRTLIETTLRLISLRLPTRQHCSSRARADRTPASASSSWV